MGDSVDFEQVMPFVLNHFLSSGAAWARCWRGCWRRL